MSLGAGSQFQDQGVARRPDALTSTPNIQVQGAVKTTSFLVTILEVHLQEAECSAGGGTFFQAGLSDECYFMARSIDAAGIQHHAGFGVLPRRSHISNTQAQTHHIADLRLQGGIDIDIQSGYARAKVNRQRGRCDASVALPRTDQDAAELQIEFQQAGFGQHQFNFTSTFWFLGQKSAIVIELSRTTGV